MDIYRYIMNHSNCDVKRRLWQMRSFFDFFPISISKTMVLLSPGRFVVYRPRRDPLVVSRIAAVVKSLKHRQLRGAVQVIVKHPDTGGGADPVAQPGFDLHRSFDPFREIHRIEVGQPGAGWGRKVLSARPSAIPPRSQNHGTRMKQPVIPSDSAATATTWNAPWLPPAR